MFAKVSDLGTIGVSRRIDVGRVFVNGNQIRIGVDAVLTIEPVDYNGWRIGLELPTGKLCLAEYYEKGFKECLANVHRVNRIMRYSGGGVDVELYGRIVGPKFYGRFSMKSLRYPSVSGEFDLKHPSYKPPLEVEPWA